MAQKKISLITALASIALIALTGIALAESLAVSQAEETRPSDSRPNRNQSRDISETGEQTRLTLSLEQEITLTPAEAIIPAAENINLTVKTERWRFYKMTPPPPHQLEGIPEVETWQDISGSLSLNFQITLPPSSDLRIELASSSDAPQPEAVVLVSFAPAGDNKFRVTVKEGASGITREPEQTQTESPGIVSLISQYKVWIALILAAVVVIALSLFFRSRKHVYAPTPPPWPPPAQPETEAASDAVLQPLAIAAGAGSNASAMVAQEESPRAELSSMPALPESKGQPQQSGQSLDLITVEDQKTEPVVSVSSLQKPGDGIEPPENQISIEQTAESEEREALDESAGKIYQLDQETVLVAKRRLEDQSIELQEVGERVGNIESKIDRIADRLEDKMEEVFLRRMIKALYQENPDLQEQMNGADQEISNLISLGASQEINLDPIGQRTDRLREAVEAILASLRRRGEGAASAAAKVSVVLNDLKMLTNELGEWKTHRSQQKIRLRFAIDIPLREARGRTLVDAVSASLTSQIKKLQKPEEYFRARLEPIATFQVMHISDVCDQELDQRREEAELQLLLKNLFDAAGVEEISAQRNEPFRPVEQTVLQFVSRQSADDRIESVACLVKRGFRCKGNILRKAQVMLFN